MGHEYDADQDATPTRAIILRPEIARSGPETVTAASLDEAVALATGIGLVVAHAREVRISKPRAATLFGEGVIEETKAEAKALDAELLIVDGALTPAQQRNLERAADLKVLDRTGLILEVFGERARTREGVLQVSLAALSYQRTRLVKSWTHLERQRGGAGFTGGPGERQIELDRRAIDDQIDRIKKQLDNVRKTRTQHRKGRRRNDAATVALVGYTNAGKSTLFNRLTGAGVLSADRLFATLDPTMRAISLPSDRQTILSDTVGFIAELPTQLVEAFRATLEEVAEADVILHVHDLANPDFVAQASDVRAVLSELGVDPDGRPILNVYNKADAADAEARAIVAPEVEAGDALVVSAATGEGVDALLAAIDRVLAEGAADVVVRIPCSEGEAIAWLHRVSFEAAAEEVDGDMVLRVTLPKAEIDRFMKRWSDIAIVEFRRRMTPDIDIDAVSGLIVEIAREEVKGKLGLLSRAEVSEKSAGDFVTSADLAVEKRLGAALRDYLPEADVLGEEAVSEGSASIDALADDRLHWVIDPIDGTGNFTIGMPLCAVILSLVRKDEVLAGWIHDPFGDRTFAGVLGGGAWFNGGRLSCHRPDDLRLMNGSIYGRQFREREEFRTLWARGRKHYGAVFNARCVGHEHMARLAGLAHFGCYSRLLPWDHAAGYMLHQEAGGIARLINGGRYKPSDPSVPGLLAPDLDVWNKLSEALGGAVLPDKIENMG